MRVERVEDKCALVRSSDRAARSLRTPRRRLETGDFSHYCVRVDPLYGRADILGQTQRAWTRAKAEQGGLLLFTGEPGIGKSRLIEQVAHEAQQEGAQIAWGRCWEAGGAPAYWPWIQVFRSLQMDDDPFAGAVADLAVGSPEARFAVFDRAVRGLRARAAQQPLLLALDDLHAADEPSLLLLLLLARELARAPILVVGGYRDAALALTPSSAGLLASVAREGQLLPLPRLGAEHVAAWLGDTFDGANVERTDELYRMTEGHPLFVVEALRLGRSAEAQATWSLGPSAVLDERLSRLSSETRALLEVGAVLGREFSLEQLAETAEIAADQVHRLLLEALASNIVLRARGERHYRFSHVLLRDRLYAELLPSLRAQLHFRAGESSLARDSASQTAVHHLFAGASAGPAEQIATVALAAAEAELSRLAFEDASQLCQRALRLPALGAHVQAELRVVLAEALIRMGQNAEGRTLCVEAAELAQQQASPLLLARAALVYGTELASSTVDARMVALLRQALAALGPDDTALHVRVLARLAAALTPPLQPEDGAEVLSLMRVSLAMARRLGDRHALLYALQFAATVGLLVPANERLALLEETLSLARALHQPLVILHTLPAYITDLLALGRRSEAEAALPDYATLMQGSRQPLQRVRFLIVHALLETLKGEFDAAEKLDEEARVVAHGEGAGGAMFLWLIHRMSMAQLRMDPTLIRNDASSMLDLWAPIQHSAGYRCWMLAGLGQRELARALLHELPLEAPSEAIALWYLLGAAETCLLLDDVETGARVYPLLRGAVDRMFWTVAAGAMMGPADRVLGDLACLLGRSQEAVAHYDSALAFCERLGAVPLIAQCQRARAAALAGEASAAASEAERAPPGESAGATNLRSLPPLQGAAIQLQREGDVWAVSVGNGPAVRLKHSKGFAYLQYLIEQAGRPVHVVELSGVSQRTGDAGPVLDARAKAEYRGRFELLREELTEAERFNDTARAQRAQDEMERLAEQLASAVGLGGRDRRAASDVERLRINVQRRIKDAIERIASQDPSLGRYLAAAVKTGVTCVFLPL